MHAFALGISLCNDIIIVPSPAAIERIQKTKSLDQLSLGDPHSDPAKRNGYVVWKTENNSRCKVILRHLIESSDRLPTFCNYQFRA